jgi:hypothetical protein
MKCILCGWEQDPCVTKDGVRREPRGCAQIQVDNGRAYNILPVLDDESSDGIGAMRRFPIEEEVAQKFDLV